eukprot:TRINITY_DN3813_c0_g1_i1.p1 TRINITY_DN3813_c0_g1~~TRINITY_DN3813_c0_g1_i1.p1  ORF type:complete len:356 (+),score=111.67 TRINITY_DN3813_c0_g1_i1:31-1098(+)
MLGARLWYYKMKRLVVAGLAAIVLLALFSKSGGSSAAMHATTGVWSQTFNSMAGGKYHIAIVADLDKKSKMDTPKPSFKSILWEGMLTREDKKWSVEWNREKAELKSPMNEAGRGMELSELVIFNDRLYTFDDRTGLMFEIDSNRKVIPREILMEGDGNVGKGQKSEWATVKDGTLYVGSFGKEYVGSMGEVTSRNNLWVSTVSATGEKGHENWTDKYNTIRATTGSVHPAYMIIETVVWSPVHKQWFILPRRVSQDPYNEETDEKKGSNIIVKCNAEITQCESFKVGEVTPERGFSSAKFVPGTNDEIMVALKSAENEADQTQETYISVFALDGTILMEETRIGANKYEGIEFI